MTTIFSDEQLEVIATAGRAALDLERAQEELAKLKFHDCEYQKRIEEAERALVKAKDLVHRSADRVRSVLGVSRWPRERM